MGTECAVAVTGARSGTGRSARALAAGHREIESCESALSRFRPNSDLSRLNRGAGHWITVDRRLIGALRVALRLREETGGLFDPTILPALAAAGYDRSFEQLEERAAAGASSWRPGAAIEIDPASSKARIDAGAAVDLGGLGKGFAAARALWAMRDAWLELPGGLVDLGGDIAVWGATPDGGPWRISIADPRRPGVVVATLAIGEGAVATSGRDQRRFGPQRALHHLIDPATGAPAEDGPVAVTVVGPYAEDVEAFATALAITPPRQAAELLHDRPDMSAILVPAVGDTVVLGALPLLSTTQLMEVSA